MKNDELIFGKILDNQELKEVVGGICITTTTVSGNPVGSDDTRSSGDSCGSEIMV